MLLESAVTIDALEVRDAAGKAAPEHELVHRRLCEYARQRSALDAAEAFDLVRAEQLRLYALHGCVTHYEYMERELAWGPHAARERIRVARALVALPHTAAALARGDRRYSAVRELTRVATPDTETAWLAATTGMIAAQIEHRVAGHKYGDHPDDPTEPTLRPRKLHLELPPEVFALWRQARVALAQERGGEVSDAELVEAMCRRILDPGTGAAAPAHQIALKQCDDCRRVTQNGAGREIDVGPDVLERAACDASFIGSLDAQAPARTTTSVTPRRREQVFARDNFRCTVPGCRSARNLEVHHIHEQSQGGTHEVEYHLALLGSPRRPSRRALDHARRGAVRDPVPLDVRSAASARPQPRGPRSDDSNARPRHPRGSARVDRHDDR